jgi:hypothetical protein
MSTLDLDAAAAVPDAGRRAPYILVAPPTSFLARYVTYAQMRTDAPPEAHELLGCGVLSALAGPSLRLPLATSITGVRLPLWTMYVVDSTTGRKTTVSEIGRDVLEEVLGSAALLQWEGSPQAIIQRLAERDGHPTIFVRDEMAGLLGQMNLCRGAPGGARTAAHPRV